MAKRQTKREERPTAPRRDGRRKAGEFKDAFDADAARFEFAVRNRFEFLETDLGLLREPMRRMEGNSRDAYRWVRYAGGPAVVHITWWVYDPANLTIGIEEILRKSAETDSGDDGKTPARIVDLEEFAAYVTDGRDEPVLPKKSSPKAPIDEVARLMRRRWEMIRESMEPLLDRLAVKLKAYGTRMLTNGVSAEPTIEGYWRHLVRKYGK